VEVGEDDAMAGEQREGPSTEASVSWRIKLRSTFTLVELVGDLNENTDLRPLRDQLKGDVVFHLAEVRRVNSSGTREWINFIHDLPAVLDITLTHCSPPVVQQLNSIRNFRGKATVRSVFVPYTCESCFAHEDRLLNVSPDSAAGPPVVPQVDCHQCSCPMEFDELAERYFEFLQDR
jgi:hypothetical protein